MPLVLADLPEEILERILALILIQSPEPSFRPSWHVYQTPSPANTPSIIAPLLVCRSWLRIATPIHYRQPVLRSPRHAELLLRALRHSPSLAQCVKSLHVHATSPALRDLVPLCTRLTTLDLTIDNADGPAGAAAAVPPTAGDAAPARPRSVIDFCEGFTKTRSIRHLVIRKNAYLTQSNAIYVFEQLAKAIGRWHRLETVNVAFRLSPSPAASALVEALAAAPRLHTLCTQLPVVWNSLLLDIAQNPALARVRVSPQSELAGAHLFLTEARRHPRLVDLIRAGMPPPAPLHPGLAFPAAPGSARARASSAVVAGKAPVPVPTWGYERDVPAPVCPPVRRAGPGAHSAPGVVAAARDFPHHQSAMHGHWQGRGQVSSPTGGALPPPPALPLPFNGGGQHPAANQLWQAHAQGRGSQHYPSPQPQQHQHQYQYQHQLQGQVVAGAPPVRRGAPGGRRMTAS